MDEPTNVKYKEVEKVEVEANIENEKKSKSSVDPEESSFMSFLKRHWASIAVIIYILSPIDIIPDFIPVAGSVDDAILLTYQLFQEYKAYRARNPKS